MLQGTVLPTPPSTPLSTLAQFAGLVGAGFVLHGATDAPLAVTLVEANPLPAHPGALRAPFALLFEGPAQPLLPQATYGLAHAALGPAPMDVFLVPVSRSPAGLRYEAVFN